MFKVPIVAAVSSAAIVLGAAAPVPVQAASVHLTPALGSLNVDSNVVDVRWRRHGHRHGWGGRDAWIALGAFGLGSALASGAYGAPYGYYEPYGYGYAPAPAYGYVAPGGADAAAWAQCEARFKSLRADGTYTTYDGEQRLCPYLR